MITTIPNEVDELTRLWPPQTIANHEVWFNAWRTSQQGNVAPRTEDHYTFIGQQWISFANGKAITPRLMLDWHQFLLGKEFRGKPIRLHRIAKYHFVVRKYLRWMMNCGIIKQDPSAFLPTMRTEPDPPAGNWTHDEYVAVTKWAEGRQEYQLPLWLWVLGYHTGMSMTDCCGLKWSEVTLRSDGPCFIRRPRNKLVRSLGDKAACVIPVLVGGELWRWLKRLERDRPPDAEFVHRDAAIAFEHGGRRLRDRISRMTSAALGATQKRSFRNLRNSFATRLVNSGADAILVSKMTGHQNLKQLADYVVADIDSMQNVLHQSLRWAEQQGKPAAAAKNVLSLPTDEQQTMNEGAK